jgi:hypothetical protein
MRAWLVHLLGGHTTRDVTRIVLEDRQLAAAQSAKPALKPRPRFAQSEYDRMRAKEDAEIAKLEAVEHERAQRRAVGP